MRKVEWIECDFTTGSQIAFHNLEFHHCHVLLVPFRSAPDYQIFQLPELLVSLLSVCRSPAEAEYSWLSSVT